MEIGDNADLRPVRDAVRAAPFDVVIAGLHPLARTGLRVLLEQDDTCRVVGEASSIRALYWETQRRKPAVVVADIDLPGVRHGAGLNDLPSPVLLVGDDDDFVHVAGVLSERVRGFVHTSRPAADLVAAVRLVGTGHVSLPPAIVGHLLDAFLANNVPEPVPPSPATMLTRRERDVLRLMVEGKSTRQIADQLVVQTSTVKTHICHLLRKLGVNDRAQAIAVAYRRGWASVGHAGVAVRHRVEAV